MHENKINFDLKKHHRITFLTGAGTSAESGVPTFRGEKGLWEKFDAEKLATVDGFQDDPKTTWEWYDLRRTQIAGLKPNMSHETIAALERNGYDVVVITQNIDNFHREAGNRNVIELHGNIWRVRCTRGCGIWEDRTAPMPHLPPTCACGSLIRPHVVWFGELLDEKILGAAYNRLFETDLCVVVGTSGIVHPAAGFPEIAKSAGAYILEINLEQTPITYTANETHLGKSGEILPLLFQKYLS